MMITIAAIITILVNWVAAICIPISKKYMEFASWKIYRASAIIINLLTTTAEVMIVVNQ